MHVCKCVQCTTARVTCLKSVRGHLEDVRGGLALDHLRVVARHNVVEQREQGGVPAGLEGEVVPMRAAMG